MEMKFLRENKREASIGMVAVNKSGVDEGKGGLSEVD